MSKDHADQFSEPESTDDFPLAEVQQPAQIFKKILGGTRMWIATAVCAVIALILVISALSSGGATITIRFDDGYGIKPGDTLRYRGIDVGEVTGVSVDSDLNGVTVRVQLEPNAVDLAREGSRFWIERPQFGLSRISGLETVVGAKFIGVIPGPSDAPFISNFEGINSPPVIRGASATEIAIVFGDGHGIKTGDLVKHLGIVVGEVTRVELAQTLGSVTVHVRLADWAAGLARAGSQFWIERPQIGLTEVRGLETLVQGRYIAVLPGPSDAQPLSEFRGLEDPPPAPRSDEGLEITLFSNHKNALGVGVPVTYRGVQVGHVVSVGLASDASSVQARVYIEPDFKALIRSNSRFWSNVGIDADFGVGGLSVKTDSMQSLVIGSIACATPDEPGRRARTGDRFECHEVFEDQWLQWNPQIAIGVETLPPGAVRPESLRVVIRWRQRFLAFTREQQRQGWLVVLEDNRLFGLRQYLEPDAEAIDGSATLELAGSELPYDASRAALGQLLGQYSLDTALASDVAPWPRTNVRVPESAEECLVVTDAQSPAIPLSAGQIDEQLDDKWLINPSIALARGLDGACVISRVDGALIGFLTFERGQAVVVLANLNLEN